jgi:hypothetical protein
VYRVQYFCPRQGPYWQGKGQFATFELAIGMAQIVKPPQGWARVIGPSGQVVYQI